MVCVYLYLIMALQKEKRKRYYSRVYIQYCKKLDQYVHKSVWYRAAYIP